MRVKMSKQPPPAPTARAVGPCPTISQIRRTPWHWKFTQHHRTIQPTPPGGEIYVLGSTKHRVLIKPASFLILYLLVLMKSACLKLRLA